MSDELWSPTGEIDPALAGYRSTGQVIVDGEIVAEWRGMGAREWQGASDSVGAGVAIALDRGDEGRRVLA